MINLLSYATTHSPLLASQNLKTPSATEKLRKMDSKKILLTTWENNVSFLKNNFFQIL